MSLPRSPVVCCGFVACLAAIIWQWPAKVDAHSRAGADGLGNEEYARDKQFVITASSGQHREISTRRISFPFEEVPAGSIAAEFLRRDPELTQMVRKRREQVMERLDLRKAGLGRKHPDIETLDDAIKAVEEKVLREWQLFHLGR